MEAGQDRPRRIVIVGGGVSGLAVAYRVSRAADSPSVVLLEAADRLGGKVDAVAIGGTRVDTGPDSLMVRAPAVSQLVDELDLRDAVREPSAGGAYLWTRGRLRPLPRGSVFGIPDRVRPLLRSRVVRLPGLARAGADLVLPRTRTGPDPTVADLLLPRLGREVFDRIVDPLLGGVHAGRAERLSARSAVPEVFRMLDGRRSAFLTVRRLGAKRPPSTGSPLVSLQGGLGALVERLRQRAVDGGVEIRTGAQVTAITRDGDGYLVTAGGEQLAADAVVVTTPTHDAATLLGGLSPELAGTLRGMESIGVATVLFAYPLDVLDGRAGTGFLVPPVDGRLLVGCTWMTQKWPHLGGTHAVVRCMVGRDLDQRFETLPDAQLVGELRQELRDSLGITAAPLAQHIRRMPAAMPQYTVGHGDRLATIDRALAAHPGLHLTGAGYRGVGLSGVITDANATAEKVLNG